MKWILVCLLFVVLGCKSVETSMEVKSDPYDWEETTQVVVRIKGNWNP